MDPNERLPEDLQRIDAALGELRSEVTAHDLDRLSQRIQRRRRAPRGLRFVRSPGIVGGLLAAAVLICGGVGTVAVSGGFSSTASSGDAQYAPPPGAALSPSGPTVSAAGKKTKKLHAAKCRKSHTHKAKTKKGRRAQAAKARKLCAKAKKKHTRRRH